MIKAIHDKDWEEWANSPEGQTSFREEKFFLKLRLDAEKLNDVEKSTIAEIFELGDFVDGDDLTIEYSFDIEYLNVIKQFMMVVNLLDKGTVLGVGTDVEVQQRKYILDKNPKAIKGDNLSLVQAFLCKLNQIEKKYQ